MDKKKEVPILFSTEMIQAYKEGRKTQTRRIVKTDTPFPFHDYDFAGGNEVGYSGFTPKGFVEVRGYSISEYGKREFSPFVIKPKYGENGHRLWFRETFKVVNGKPIYKADLEEGENPYPNIKWKPSIFMPRKYSRFNPLITKVRIDRLLNISEEDAIAEGIFFTDYGMTCFHFLPDVIKYDPSKCPAPKEHHNQRPGWSYEKTNSHEQCLGSAKFAYLNLWDKINGKGSHEENPFVWIIDFEGV